jgi:hypothetical protein
MKRRRQPIVGQRIDDEMHAVGGAVVGNAVRIGQPQIPRAAGRHDDAAAVEQKLDMRIGRDRDVQPHGAALESEVVVPVFLDDRTGPKPHQANRPQRAFEGGEQFAEIGRVRQQRGVLEFFCRGAGIDHHDRMCRAGLRAQRDDAPIPVVILFDEVTDPFAAAQAAEVVLQPAGIEIKRQPNAVGELDVSGFSHY